MTDNSIAISEPEPSFWLTRLVRGGPFVGAAIYHRPPNDPETGLQLDRPALWEAWIDGRLARDPSPDPVEAGVFLIWGSSSRRIDENEFNYWTASGEWNKMYRPDSPESAPWKPVETSKIPPILPE